MDKKSHISSAISISLAVGILVGLVIGAGIAQVQFHRADLRLRLQARPERFKFHWSLAFKRRKWTSDRLYFKWK